MDYIDLFNARTTRQQSSVAVSQNSDKAFRYNMNLPVNETALGQKRGFMVFDSDTGRRLRWDFTKWLGEEIIKNRTYFYVISSDAGAIDEIDGRGKIKLGYSASAAGSTFETALALRSACRPRSRGSPAQAAPVRREASSSTYTVRYAADMRSNAANRERRQLLELVGERRAG